MAAAELQGLFASVIHEGPPEATQLRGLFASVIHEDFSVVGSTGYVGLLGGAQVDRPGLVGSSVSVIKRK
jgi:hypothetical protein